MPRRIPIFGVILLTCVVLGGRLLLGVGEAQVGEVLRRGLFLGGPLLEIRAPLEGRVVPMAGVQVLVGFPDANRVAPETLRCLLNGVDVTDLLTVGENGAGGSVFPLMEGRNRLRLEVFGRGRERGTFFEDAQEVVFRAQRPLWLDRA